MKVNTQKAYAYSGVAMMVMLLAALLIAGWLPPPGPHESARQVAHDYQAHTTAIRIGMMVGIFGAALLGPFVASIAVQMRRIDDGVGPSAYCQLALGSMLIIEFVLPFMIFEVAAFRPDRSPDITLALSDIGWILLVATVSTAVVELLLVGLAIGADKHETPIFPKWAATFSYFVAAVFSLGAGAVFTEHGPFAWNGLLSFWVPLSVFGAWLLVMTVLLARAIDSQAVELTR
ncbi:MAG TPA: hypothetical protein VHV76_00500 [Mycobacteriales bacterium]|jgi:hypothetical protein|nr:hypothetical protein [Mycobacteriales bacterium]